MSGHNQYLRAEDMLTVVIVIHLMIVLTMIGVVLLQRSEGGGLGVGSTGGFLSSRGTANVLTRTTAFLAMAFFATSLLLSLIAGTARKPSSILNTGAPANQQQPTEGAPLPPLPAPGPGGLLNQLGGGQQGGGQQGQPPVPPSGPQVPQSQ